MPDLKDIVLDFVLRSGLDPEDISDFIEGVADALRKGLKPQQAALYGLLETQSEELSQDADVTEALVGTQQYTAEERQQILRRIFRALARKF